MTLIELPNDSRLSEKRLKEELSAKLHAQADTLDWCHLPIPQKAKHYEAWAADPAIGGRLAEVIGSEKVHMYIKDTVMRAYRRSRRPDLESLLRKMNIHHHYLIQSYEKPHALLYDHTHLYTLTVAKEWRMAMLSAYERAARASETVERNLILITDHQIDRFVDRSYRELIETAGKRLDVEVHWVK